MFSIPNFSSCFRVVITSQYLTAIFESGDATPFRAIVCTFERLNACIVGGA